MLVSLNASARELALVGTSGGFKIQIRENGIRLIPYVSREIVSDPRITEIELNIPWRPIWEV